MRIRCARVSPSVSPAQQVCCVRVCVCASRPLAQVHFLGMEEPVQKQLVFYQPHFGVVFKRDVDTFGFNPVVIVHAIAPESPAAGLLGVGDQLIAVDNNSITCVGGEGAVCWGGGKVAAAALRLCRRAHECWRYVMVTLVSHPCGVSLVCLACLPCTRAAPCPSAAS